MRNWIKENKREAGLAFLAMLWLILITWNYSYNSREVNIVSDAIINTPPNFSDEEHINCPFCYKTKVGKGETMDSINHVDSCAYPTAKKLLE